MHQANRLEARIARYRHFYESPKGALMVNIFTGSDGRERLADRPQINELDWRDATSMRAYAEALLQERFMTDLQEVDDDAVYSAFVLAGTGAIAASFVRGAVLTQERETNYLDPPIKNWEADDIGRIGFDPETPTYLALMEMLQHFISRWDGSYAITPFVHFGPLDLANQFRGNDVMYDFYEEPERLHHLLGRCTEAILALEAHTRATYYPKGASIPAAVGGCLIPRGSYLSCDIGDMISSELLREFELTYVNRILRRWGGGYQHHHELGNYQIPVWAESKGMSVQFLNRDFNTTHLGAPGGINETIIEASRRLPIHFICTYEEFTASAAGWARGKFVVNVQCESKAQADEVCLTARRLRGF